MPKKPVVKEIVPFDARCDANFIFSSLCGKVREDNQIAVIDLLTHRSLQQRQDIAAEFFLAQKRDLVDFLQRSMGDNVKDVVSALFQPPDVQDALALHEALHGDVTDEETLIEIICTRTNAELTALRDAYTTLYDRDVVEVLTSKSSGDFRRLLMAIVLGIRDESDEVGDPIQLRDQARNEAQLLYEPIAEKASASQLASNLVIMLANPSFAQLKLTLREFEKLAGIDLERVINRSLSGNFAMALNAIVRISKNRNAFFAEEIQRAAGKNGSEDKRLTRLVLSRTEKDLAGIKTEFQKLYKVSLDTIITGDNSYGSRSVLASVLRAVSH